MPYVTSVERDALKRGREEGREQGLRQSLLTVLESRFGQIPEEAHSWISELSASELDSLLRRAAVASSLEELR